MENTNMSFDVRKTMIHKDVYRPSSNIGRFAKFLFSIIVIGQSPIQSRLDGSRRPK